MSSLITRLISTFCCASVLTLYACPVLAESADRSDSVTVEGRQLLRGGRPWIPHGFFQVAFAVPPTYTDQKAFYRQAYEGYSPSEYDTMKAEGADSVRMQLAQDGADPSNDKFFDASWLQQAIDAVHAARAAGLIVILSIQDEKQTGVRKEAPLPDEATRRVWTELAPIFGKDRGVLFELYNEPNDLPASDTHPDTDLPPTQEQWELWAHAMNETIKTVRDLGARNVVVADGLVHAQQLTGAPDLIDPLHQVVYAAHPYVNGPQRYADFNQTAAAWEEKFGRFSRTHPVIISEWAIGYFCDTKTPESVVNFLRYLQNHQIGLEAGLWDFEPAGFNNLTHGFPDDLHFSTFLNVEGKTCTLNDAPPDYGPGKTVESWYLTGTPPNAPQ